jgi:hypothetical protein
MNKGIMNYSFSGSTHKRTGDVRCCDIGESVPPRLMQSLPYNTIQQGSPPFSTPGPLITYNAICVDAHPMPRNSYIPTVELGLFYSSPLYIISALFFRSSLAFVRIGPHLAFFLSSFSLSHLVCSGDAGAAICTNTGEQSNFLARCPTLHFRGSSARRRRISSMPCCVMWPRGLRWYRFVCGGSSSAADADEDEDEDEDVLAERARPRPGMAAGLVAWRRTRAARRGSPRGRNKKGV